MQRLVQPHARLSAELSMGQSVGREMEGHLP